MNKFKMFLGKHSPVICMIFGTISVVASVVTACRATVKAKDIVDAEKEKLEEGEELDKAEIAKKVLPLYIPSAACLTGGLGLLYGGAGILAKRLSASTELLGLTESAYQTYKAVTEAEVGEKKALDIQEKVAEKTFEQKPIPKGALDMPHMAGEILCMEKYSQNYFWSTLDDIREAFIWLREQLGTVEEYISHNDLLDRLGADELPVLGELAGYNAYSGLPELRYTTKLSPEDIPVLLIWSSVEPTTNYNRFS